MDHNRLLIILRSFSTYFPHHLLHFCFLFYLFFFFNFSGSLICLCFSFSWVRVSVLTIIFVSDFHSFISMQSDFVYFPFCSTACVWVWMCSVAQNLLHQHYLCLLWLFLGDRIHPVLLLVVVCTYTLHLQFCYLNTSVQFINTCLYSFFFPTPF